MSETIETTSNDRGASVLLVPFLVGAVVAVVLGVYGTVHTGTGVGVNVAGFSGPLEAKVWLTSLAALLALVQLGSALVMFGKIRWFGEPSWIGGLHRWAGRLAFLAAVPVAIHCLYSIGFSTGTPRALLHSVAGTLFFGVFTVKMLGLRKDGLPGWALPLLGGLAFTLLIAVWSTSSLWFFTTIGVRF